MNRIVFSLRYLLRDWRSGELRIIALALVIAVASLTTVGFFTDRIEQAMEIQATELLAADLVLSSSAPIAEPVRRRAEEMNLVTSLSSGFRSVIMAGETLQMAEVKAVDESYPIRGALKVADVLFAPDRITREVPARGEAWADARLLQLLNLSVGDTLEVGASTLKVTRVLTFEPDRGGDLFNIAPRLLMNQADVDATGLILPGSRVSYHLLLGGQIADLNSFRAWVSDNHGGNIKVRGIRDARPELKTALDRAGQFLGLAALVSIALAGMAVAMSTQRYVSRHLDHCAIMRCLGTSQAVVLHIYLIQCLVLALVSSVIGSAIGYLCQQGLAVLMSGLVQGQLPPPSPWPVLTGILTGIITVCGFAVPQLLRIRAVSPMRVLRRDLTPLPVSGVLVYAAAIVALALLIPWQSGEPRLSVYSLAGLLVTALALAGGARLIITGIRRLKLRGAAIRYGLANVSRRGGQSVAQIIGIGLGFTVMLLLALIRTDLLENWRDRLPPGTPNYFLINIQPEEVRSIQNTLYEQGRVVTDFFPMIRGRLVRINDWQVEVDAYGDDRARRLVSREFNLSFTETMQSHNRLVAGDWWQPGEDQVFSVEEGIAETLGINLGDSLTYEVAGREVSGVVKNLRWVEWDSFNVNFFVISSPGTLEGYPATYITSFYLPPGEREVLTTLVRNYPSVTVFDVDAVLSQVRLLMNQVIRAVEYVFGFTLLAGLAVLFAALQTTHDERRHESALLSAMGATRRQILFGLIAEFVCLGLVAGLLAALGATFVQWLLAEFVFNLSVSINPRLWIAGPLLSVAVIVIGGLAGTRRTLTSPPMLALRQV